MLSIILNAKCGGVADFRAAGEKRENDTTMTVDDLKLSHWGEKKEAQN